MPNQHRQTEKRCEVHGPHRTEYSLEYPNPETGQATRLSRCNLHVHRIIA